MFHPLAPIASEECFSKNTSAAVDEINSRILDHLRARDAFQAKASAIAEAPADQLDPDELFDPTVAAERFRLRRAELQIRRDLADVLKLRAADRRAEADRLYGLIEEAREKVIAKLHKIGFTGDGKVWNQTAVGSIFPGMVHLHPLVVEAAQEAQDARALANRFHDASTNTEAIAELEQAINNARRLAAAA